MNTREAFEKWTTREPGTLAYHHECGAWLAATAAAEEKYLGMIRELVNIVNKQAEDEGLWFVSEYITEAYLQKELRRLHGAIEAIAAPLLGESK